jgi:pyruvate formate lyase activating enzyme
MRNVPPTPLKTLEKLAKVAKKAGLHYVYIGNVYGHAGENTYCPNCGKLLIERQGYAILENNIRNGKCPQCGDRIAGVWK